MSHVGTCCCAVRPDLAESFAACSSVQTSKLGPRMPKRLNIPKFRHYLTAEPGGKVLWEVKMRPKLNTTAAAIITLIDKTSGRRR